MSKPKSAKWADIHAEAIREFDDVQIAVRDTRLQCLDDRRFLSITGAQWEGDVGEAFSERVRFEFNKIHLAVIRIFSEYRNNRVTVDFTPKDGSPNDEMADTCDGLYRADEKLSTAQEAYDNAFEEAVSGGFGAWRLTTKNEDEDDDENTKQRIHIEPIYDADTTVFFSLDGKRADKADATKCWVLIPMTPEGYKAEWGEDASSVGKNIHRQNFDWVTPDVVWVAEYYVVEKKTELVHIFRSLAMQEQAVEDEDLDEEKAAELRDTGWREVRQKRRTERKVRKYLINGSRVLEDCGQIAGKHIPVIPAYGKRWVVDGIERCMGHVRLAKDAQRLQNMLMSWLADMAWRGGDQVPVLTPEMVAGHAQMWANQAVKRFPYLLVNPVTDQNGNETVPPLQYTKSPDVPPAMGALAQLAGQALNDLLGNPQAGEQVASNVSGRLVELVQQRLDMQSFIYLDNLRNSVKRCGAVWLDMAREVYVEPDRPMKMYEPDGTSGQVTLNQQSFDEESGAYITANDLTEATFDVDADVGPSSSSKRESTVRNLIVLRQGMQDPEMSSVVEGLILMNMEGEGLQDARDYSRRRLLRMGAVKPTDDEAQELAQEQQAKAGQPPDPQSQALIGMAEEATANAAQARAKTLETLASADLKKAQEQKTLMEAHAGVQSSAVSNAVQLHSALNPPKPSNKN